MNPRPFSSTKRLLDVVIVEGVVDVLAALFPLGNPEGGEVDDLAVVIGDEATFSVGTRAAGEIHVFLVHEDVAGTFLVVRLAGFLAELHANTFLAAVLAGESGGVEKILLAVLFLALCEDGEFHGFFLLVKIEDCISYGFD